MNRQARIQHLRAAVAQSVVPKTTPSPAANCRVPSANLLRSVERPWGKPCYDRDMAVLHSPLLRLPALEENMI